MQLNVPKGSVPDDYGGNKNHKCAAPQAQQIGSVPMFYNGRGFCIPARLGEGIAATGY
jgi:hypothetical protein